MTPRISLGYLPSQLVKISRRCKDKQSFTQHVMVKEIENDNAMSGLKSSVFDRLQPLTPHKRPSVFKRMGRDKTSKPSVFQRLQGSKQPKPSVFTGIKTRVKFSSSSLTQDGNSVFTHLGKVNEVQSFIPSSMKRICTFDVKTVASLKVKRRTLGITNCKAS